ncbi:MAG TPA: 4Fe-4S binding protein, partial [Chloroflexota bacterium]|nr:4Fe-4S binding protein [Chloroflexota bacterium]
EGVDSIVFIDPDECIDCGACESACPVTAIYDERSVPEQWSEFISLNRLWFEDKDTVRLRLQEVPAA